MRIDLNTRTAESSDTSVSNPASHKAKGKAAAETGLGEAARVSLDGDRLRKLEAVANSAPDLRTQRVKTLSGALSQGNYQVKAEDTAHAMLSDKLARLALFR